MTPLPKRRHSTRRGGKRKAAISLESVAFTVCKQCKTHIRPHTVCPECGYYSGSIVVTKRPTKAKKQKQS